MKDAPAKAIVPDHEEGIKTDTENLVEHPSEDAAKVFYKKAKQRLLDVNCWHGLAGSITAKFCLTDNKGTPVHRPAQEGDYFQIDLPAPGTNAGDGYDWVRIEAIEEAATTEKETTAIRVRPAANPTSRSADTAHFFSEEATSCFIIKREGNSITAGVHGRNEKPNVHTESTSDNLRNAAVATTAFTGLAKIQWKSLVKGLLSDD